MSDKTVWDVRWKDEKNKHVDWKEIGIIVEETNGQVKFKLHAHCPMSYLAAVQAGGGWCMAYKRPGKGVK